MQSVIDLARLDLNDADKVRNTDAQMLASANDGIARTIVLRPDLQYGSYGSTFADLSTASSFPLPLEYRKPIADFIVMCCETHDDPFAIEQRAINALTLYIKGLGL